MISCDFKKCGKVWKSVEKSVELFRIVCQKLHEFVKKTSHPEFGQLVV